MFVCLLNLEHAPSRELPLTACKTVFSHLKMPEPLNHEMNGMAGIVKKVPFLSKMVCKKVTRSPKGVGRRG